MSGSATSKKLPAEAGYSEAVSLNQYLIGCSSEVAGHCEISLGVLSQITFWGAMRK